MVHLSASLIFCIFFPIIVLIILVKASNSSTKLPKSYPIFGSFFTVLKNRERYVQWTSDIVASTPNLSFLIHGAFGRKIIITANATIVQHILKSNFGNYEKGKSFRDNFRDFIGDGIFNVDGEKWKLQRQIFSHEFNSKSLRKFVECVVDYEISGRLIPILKSAAVDKTVVDFQDILQRFSFDSICRIVLGYDPASLSPSLPVAKIAVALEKALKHSIERSRSFIPNFWKIKKALNIGSEKELKIAVHQVREFTKEIIRKKRQEIDRKSVVESVDLLSRFVSSGFSDEDFVADVMLCFTLAGQDTTSAALTWFFWLISTNPEVENEIIKEISEKSKAPDSDEVKDMIYTHASLCETMRLYPPVPMDVKVALNDDVLPDGTVVKKGTRVTYHPYAMGRVENVWGKDWPEFCPERWLHREEAAEKWSFVNRDPYTYPVFQAGPRICLGKEMAFMQMKRVVAAVVRRFKVVPVVVEGAEPVFISVVTAKMKGGFPVRIEVRSEEEC